MNGARPSDAAKIGEADRHRRRPVAEAPLEHAAVGGAHPLVGGDLRLLDVPAQEEGAQHGEQRQRAEQRAEQRERHGVRHRPEQPPGRPGQHVDRQVGGDDDGNRVEDRPLDVARRVADDLGQVVGLVVALGQLAEDVLHHYDRAVHDHAEVDGANRQQVGGDVRPVQADEREQQRERDRDRDDERGADAEEKDAEDDEHEDHAADQVLLDRPRRLLDQAGPIVVRHDLHVRRQHRPVERLGQRLDLLQHHLRLLADTHQDDPFDGVVLVHEAELPEPRRVAHGHPRDVLHVHRDAAVGRDHDVADVLEVADLAEAAHVEELAALRVEAAAGVGVVRRELARDLRDVDAVRRQLVRIELHLVFHRRPAQPRVVGDALDGAELPLEHPLFQDLEILRPSGQGSGARSGRSGRWG